MKKAVVIVAGGMGARMKHALPKQFMEIDSRPILFYTLQQFYLYDNEMQIILVLPDAHILFWKELIAALDFKIPHQICVGGETRYHSVKNGMEMVEKADYVAIHDGVRPFITPSFIDKLFYEAKQNGSAIPIKAINETIRKITDEYTEVLKRHELFLIQTPQVFKKDWLDKAYELPYNVAITDDALLIEQAGYKLHFTEGLISNIKITTPEDMILAKSIYFHLKND